MPVVAVSCASGTVETELLLMATSSEPQSYHVHPFVVELVVCVDVEVGAAWNKKGQASGNDYVSVSLAAPEFGDRTIYANLGRAAGSENENEFALIWNPNS